MTLIKNSLSTTQEMTRSFTVLRQDTGSTGSKIIRHKRQHSDSSGRNVSLRSLKRSLSSTIRTYKNATQKQPPKGMGNKSHHKSALSLNASKISERNTSKKRLNTKISKNSIVLNPNTKSLHLTKTKGGDIGLHTDRNLATELVPLKGGKIRYHAQNFKKLK
mmetsp:Transcript_8188/g.7787  ORF Transcript_8188/g.7787 Transcript_8188/m.7787 type:complete len:162 (+) Transcript_8188:751-1236(+)